MEEAESRSGCELAGDECVVVAAAELSSSHRCLRRFAVQLAASDLERIAALAVLHGLAVRQRAQVYLTDSACLPLLLFAVDIPCHVRQEIVNVVIMPIDLH